MSSTMSVALSSSARLSEGVLSSSGIFAALRCEAKAPIVVAIVVVIVVVIVACLALFHHYRLEPPVYRCDCTCVSTFNTLSQSFFLMALEFIV